jgi:hypothetical protein
VCRDRFRTAGPRQVIGHGNDLRIWQKLLSDIVTQDDAVRIVRSYIEGLFPKVCPKCGRHFGSLREYLRSTTHLGSPVLYEAPGDEIGANPLGPIAHAACLCGNTLTIASEGLPKAQLVELITWARADAHRQSIGMTELMRQLRDRIDREVLREDESSSPRHRRLNDSQ